MDRKSKYTEKFKNTITELYKSDKSVTGLNTEYSNQTKNSFFTLIWERNIQVLNLLIMQKTKRLSSHLVKKFPL